MKRKIILFATLTVLLVNATACSTAHHRKDNLNNDKASADHRNEMDHERDNNPLHQ